MDTTFGVETRGTTVLVRGVLDLTTTGDLRTAALAAAEGQDLLTIDLRGVNFIDSTGLGCLLELRASLLARGAATSVVVDEGPVRQAIELTGLGELLGTA